MPTHVHKGVIPARREVWRLHNSRALQKRKLGHAEVWVKYVHHCNCARYCHAIVTVLDDSEPVTRFAVTVELRRFKEKIA